MHTGIDCQVKRAVSPEVICRLMTDKKPLPERLSFTGICLSCCFLLRGMPFVDLAFLRKCDLQNVIVYHRHKTRRKLTVVVCPEAMAIIEKYKDMYPDSPYLLLLFKIPSRTSTGSILGCCACITTGCGRWDIS